jgi:hypothetical protein
MLEQARNELYVEIMDILMTHIYARFNWDFGWACRENGAQEYSTGYAQDLDEIRALWMAMAQRREALTVRDAHWNAMFALTVHDLSFNLAWSTGTTTPVSRTAAH